MLNLVKEGTKDRNVTYSVQKEQLGTGDAVKAAKEFLKGKDGVVAVFTGDSPLTKVDTIEKLFNEHEQKKNSATLMSAYVR